MLFSKKTLFAALYTSAAFAIACTPASAMSLQEAIQKALTTNPQISQAVENREAVEFELRQARGLYLPSIDLEASVGKRRLSNDSTGTLTQDYETFNSSEVGLTVTQRLLDGGGRRAQVDQQASRVDGASFRVLERSETVALQVVQDYLEYILQTKIVGVAKQNVDFHNGILGDINQGISGGALTEVDALQGRERLDAARARLREAQEELELTKIRFLKTVGEPITNAKVPGSVAKFIPRTLQDAIATAKSNNPRIYSARADIDAPMPPCAPPVRTMRRPSISKAAPASVTMSAAARAIPTTSRFVWSPAGTSTVAASTRHASRNRSAAPASSVMPPTRFTANWRNRFVRPGTSAAAVANSRRS